VAPRVTALVAAPRGRVRVDLDGEQWRTLPAAVVVGARLVVGTELDRQRARTVRGELRRVEALAIGTAALARRDQSSAAVTAKLERRGVAPAERVRAVETLERAGYVDDARFAGARARMLADRGQGDAAIRFDLERNGLTPAAIEAAIAALRTRPFARPPSPTSVAEACGRRAGSRRRASATR
jgi:hypothetical protein